MRLVSDSKTGIFWRDNFLEMILDDLLETSVAVKESLEGRICHPENQKTNDLCSFNFKRRWTILPFFRSPYGNLDASWWWSDNLIVDANNVLKLDCADEAFFGHQSSKAVNTTWIENRSSTRDSFELIFLRICCIRNPRSLLKNLIKKIGKTAQKIAGKL